MVGRYGLRRYRLTIFPPGVSTADRRLLRLWRGWPIWGAVLWLVAQMSVSNVVSSETAMAVSATGYLAVGATLFVLAGTARAQVRSMSVILIHGYADPQSETRYTEWARLVRFLTLADEMRERGAVSAVEHEAAWWTAYDRLEAAARV